MCLIEVELSPPLGWHIDVGRSMDGGGEVAGKQLDKLRDLMIGILVAEVISEQRPISLC